MATVRKKTTNEPECSHVKHNCEKIFRQICIFLCDRTSVDCGVWKWGGLRSVKCEDSGVLSGECSV